MNKRGLGLAALSLCAALAGCGDDDAGRGAADGSPTPSVTFVAPLPGQLSVRGEVPINLALAPGVDPTSLRLSLDDQDLTVSVRGAEAISTASVDRLGTHHLSARALLVSGTEVQTAVSFETIDLRAPDECEVLNNSECLLPYPSARFLEPADTPTGWRVKLPQVGMPKQRNQPIPVEPYNQADGFSPTVQVLMHFPGGVDIERSGAARLHDDTRSLDSRSLDADSPSVLIDADDGTRVLHFLENDARATDPARRILFLRPGSSLTPGHRYIVAMRNLVHADGSAVEAEASFAALRDGRPTSIPGIEVRRDAFADIFTRLERFGVERRSLVLAFDFVVASDASLTGEMVSMRDQAFRWLEEQEAAAGAIFTVTQVEESDCTQPGVRVWRDIDGTFDVPLFLSDDPETKPATLGRLLHGEDGSPSPVGLTHPVFSVRIPCSVLGQGGTPKPPLLLGHGLFLSGRGYVHNLSGANDFILGATDWRGLSGRDIDRDGDLTRSFVGRVLLQLREFPALPDRLRQGMLNTLVLARLLRRGTFHRHEAFLLPSGEGVLAGPEEEANFLGASLGGIMGTMFGSLSPDVDKLAFSVSAFNFSFLLQRATLFASFEGVFRLSGLSDPMHQALVLSLLHEQWVRAEGAGYATHVTTNALPGVNAKRVLLSSSQFDQSVSNQATEIAARTLGLPSLLGSKQHDLAGIPDLAGPLASAWVHYDSQSYSLTDPGELAYIPPLSNRPAREDHCDPHFSHGSIPAVKAQLFKFLSPGGAVENTCDGICNGDVAKERPGGGRMPCQPDGTPVDITRLE